MVEVGLGQLGDEHRGHPIEGRAALLRNCLEHGLRFEGGARQDDAGPVGGRSQVPHHHAEAVVIGHRDTDPVAFRDPAPLPDEVAVVQDVQVGEVRPLRESGRA